MRFKSTYWKWAVVAVVVLTAYLVGYRMRGSNANNMSHADHGVSASASEPTTWTCSMHPQIKLPEPGQCPICYMDLIPMEANESGDEAPRTLTVSEASAALMELETTAVERRTVTAEVRMVGKVDYDETRVSYITAWVPGRLDRLFVDYTGIQVRQGDHMVELYSPDLLSAQEELLQALAAADEIENEASSVLRKSAMATIEAVREKLRLWGLTPSQIRRIEERGRPEDKVTIYAPVAGIVVEKNAREGMYVETGTRIYTIADLSQVWVHLNAYESDLAWLRYGQNVAFTTESHPGVEFRGTISFIHPILDEATRTVKLRVNVPNEDRQLKPGMFVRALVKAEMGAGGKVRGMSMTGRWMCPMHPGEVADEPGDCSICGMPLEPAEEQGYGDSDSDGDPGLPLVIPASAVLRTGERAVVYVEVPDREKLTYQGRVIRLGSRAGDYFVVLEGLREGDRVVTKGQFKLDAELQIQAVPSMMMPEKGASADRHAGHAGHTMEPAMTHEEETSEPRQQTHCPIMGGTINKDVFIDYNGMRIYFCCPGCEKTFMEDPEKYLMQMRAEGVAPESIEETDED